MHPLKDVIFQMSQQQRLSLTAVKMPTVLTVRTNAVTLWLKSIEIKRHRFSPIVAAHQSVMQIDVCVL